MEIIKGEKRPDIKTLSPQARKAAQDYSNLQTKVTQAQKRLSHFRETCNHVVYQRTSKYDVWEHNPDGLGSAYCLICGSSFGWACPDSKDGVCHYECEIDDDGTMKLHDHSRVKPEYEFGGECCVFCGHPEERK